VEVFESIYTFARLGNVLVYAFSSATIVVIVNRISLFVRSSDNVVVAPLAAIAGALLQGARKLVVFVAIPMLVADNIDCPVTRGACMGFPRRGHRRSGGRAGLRFAAYPADAVRIKHNTVSARIQHLYVALTWSGVEDALFSISHGNKKRISAISR
jgi:hypothetical protein